MLGRAQRAVIALSAALVLSLVLVSAVGAQAQSAQAQTLSQGLLLPSGAASGSAQSDPLYQLACPAAGDCVGVGAYRDTSADNQALIETEKGGEWSAANVPDASLPNASSSSTPPPQPYLTGVACTSVGNCVAADAYDDANGDEQGLIDVESAGTWSPIEAPLSGLSLSANPGVEVADVSCPAAGACVGIGSYVTSTTYEEGLIETQTASGWSASQMPMPGTADDSSSPNFYDISCSSAGNCAAAGYYTDSYGNQQGLLETELGGVWQPATELDLSNLDAATNPEAQVSDISCPADGSCTAVGSYEDSAGGDEPLEVQETDGVWGQAAALTLPANASDADVGSNPPQSDLFLNGVSCAAVGDCVAVGSYDAGSDTGSGSTVEPLSVTESLGSWATASELTLPSGDALTPAGNPQAALDSVTCPSPGSCFAAGTYVNSTGANVALVAQGGGGSWSTAAAGLPSSYDANLADLYWNDIACASGPYCAAGGYVADDVSGNDEGFILTAPSGPTGLSVTFSGSQATVSWPGAGNGGLPIGGFTITANDLSSAAGGGQQLTLPGSASGGTISGLVPTDSYTFTVTATNLLGTGVPVTSASVSGAAPHVSAVPTTAQLRASLQTLLKRSTLAAALRALRRSRHYRLAYRPIEAGRLTIGWYCEQKRRRGGTRKLLIAAGDLSASRTGQILRTNVRLTRAGTRLRRAGTLRRHPRLTVSVSFYAATAEAGASGATATVGGSVPR